MAIASPGDGFGAPRPAVQTVVLTATITASASQNNLSARQTTITPSGGSVYTYAGALTKPTGSSAALDSATSASPSFTPDKAGIYVVTLTATDISGATVTKVSTLEVGTTTLSVSIASIANQLAASGVITCDSTVSNALGSVSYAWTGTKPDGTAITFSSATAADPTITLVVSDRPGVYSVTVTVTDAARAQTATATTTFRVGNSRGDAIVYQVDLAAHANATPSGGVLTIDGKSWSTLNEGAATTFDVANGTGLRLTANAAGALALASNPCPTIYTAISNLFAAYDPVIHDLAIVMESDDVTGGTDGFFVGFTATGANRIGSVGSTDRGVVMTVVMASGNHRVQAGYWTGGSPAINSGAATDGGTIYATMVERRGIRCFRPRYTQTSGDVGDITAASWETAGVTGTGLGVEDASGALTGAADEVILGSMGSNSLTVTKLTLWRLG